MVSPPKPDPGVTSDAPTEAQEKEFIDELEEMEQGLGGDDDGDNETATGETPLDELRGD
jgi:hypothetical protein